MKLSTLIAHAVVAADPVTDRISDFASEVKHEMDIIRVDRAREAAIDANVPAIEIAKVFETPLSSKARAAELHDLAHRFKRVAATVGELKLKEI